MVVQQGLPEINGGCFPSWERYCRVRCLKARGKRKRLRARSSLVGNHHHMWCTSDQSIAPAVPDSSPLIYLLSSNQMIDNDYRLPSYVSSSDRLVIPEVHGAGPPDDLAVSPKRPAEEKNGTNMTEPPLLSSVARNGTVNGTHNRVVDRQKGNVMGHEGWVETPQANGPPEDGFYPVLAIDCEMVCHPASHIVKLSTETGFIRGRARTGSGVCHRLPVRSERFR